MKSKILRTAGALFLQYGLRSVSIDDICRELHISKKSFYLYFKQKDMLIAEMLQINYERRCEGYQKLLSCDNVIDSLIDNHKLLLASSTLDKNMTFFFDLKKYYPEILCSYEDKMKELEFKEHSTLLQRGIEQKLFREDMNVDAMALVFVGLTLYNYDKLSKLKMSASQKIEFLLDSYMRLVTNEAGLEYYKEKGKK